MLNSLEMVRITFGLQGEVGELSDPAGLGSSDQEDPGDGAESGKAAQVQEKFSQNKLQFH